VLPQRYTHRAVVSTATAPLLLLLLSLLLLSLSLLLHHWRGWGCRRWIHRRSSGRKPLQLGV